MKNVIGIRRETRYENERRAPLTPSQVETLVSEYGVHVIVEPSPQRVFEDVEYERAGATMSSALADCNIVFGVKEIDAKYLQPGLTYCYFSHTIKAQAYNMAMLGHILAADISLLDYELVTNPDGKRLVSFGNYAGYAGMIDSLWALGRRLEWEGIPNPFTVIKPAWRYDSLDEARAAVEQVGRIIQTDGLPQQISPLVCAFTGRGKVSQGARSVYNLLPSVKVLREELPELARPGHHSRHHVYGLVYLKEDLYEHRNVDTPFDLDDFTENPSYYKSALTRDFDHLDMIINGIYWEPRFPRLLTNAFMRSFYEKRQRARLRVIGDITCDIEGSIEFTAKATTSENPVYVYEPGPDKVVDGVAGDGPVVLSLDRLPAELPRESSESFGKGLLPFVHALANADFDRPYEELAIPPPFRKAVIVHKGHLTDNFRYLKNYLL